MKLTGRALVVSLSSLLSSSVALGQTPPATQPVTPPAAQPAPMPPAEVAPDPQAMPGEPPKTGSIDEETVESEPEVHWGFGARSYFAFVPTWLFNLFVEHSTPMQTVTFAGSVIRRKGNMDIQFSVEYGQYSPDNGLWQEKGEDPSQVGMYPDYNEYDNLGMVSIDASFIWHLDLTDFMQFRYGAGIGVGVVFGGGTQTDQVCDSNTTVDDLDDPTASGKCHDNPAGTTEEIDIPPVLPVVNLLVGLRFKLVDQLTLNVEGGYRFPAFFVGGGIGYFF